ncbi:MAG: NifU family protein, partial [Candidatus Brocadiales bacterium]|nr:NifU family protein [Candidatus Brocadiales bacterium]
IALRGQCAACSSAAYTTESVEEKLREMVSPDIVVHLQSDS